jgi:hypothetical protein
MVLDLQHRWFLSRSLSTEGKLLSMKLDIGFHECPFIKLRNSLLFLVEIMKIDQMKKAKAIYLDFL